MAPEASLGLELDDIQRGAVEPTNHVSESAGQLAASPRSTSASGGTGTDLSRISQPRKEES